MSALEKLSDVLKVQKRKNSKTVFNYVVPTIWVHNLKLTYKHEVGDGDVLVNPYEYLIELIKTILKKRKKDINYSNSLSLIQGENSNGDWIKKSVVYSMMPRASASYDHDRTGALELNNIYKLKDIGTFVKSIALIPYLASMGITLIYLLPIAEYTRLYKKGELGSPYGVKDFYNIDPDLFDQITGEELSVDEQFKAFVEACHIYGIRVAMDYIPRTNARDSVLVKSHPDWFYWIKKDDEAIYHTPFVDGVDKLTVAEAKYAPLVYASSEVKEFIKLFQRNPKDSNPKKWQEVLQILKDNPTLNHLEVIEKEFGLTVAPAFADVINDSQPAWSDVTFFRMYLDHPNAAKAFVTKQEIPYMLFDIAKSSLNPGNIPNQELWDLLADIIPNYQRNFGIDGMRIDMGHAIPQPLTSLIIKNAKIIDPDFCFIAEELNGKNALVAKELGYNLFIGDGFWLEPRLREFGLQTFFYNSFSLPLPIFACCETHDTKRATARLGGGTTTKLLTILNLFIPNGIPFINSGQELYEVQPMNTGIDCTPEDAFSLNKKDAYYGKLALFDKYAMHYKNETDLPYILNLLTTFRNQFINLFTDSNKAVPLWFAHMKENGVGVGYVESKGSPFAFLIVGHTNVDYAEAIYVRLDKVYERIEKRANQGTLIYSTHEAPRTINEFDIEGNLMLYMQPGEVKIIKI
ncbi:MAG: alpha-amylase [Bacillales bacterium]|jgi:glycosidase|nr:alpha-amylase [Bacillales bacterium]